LGSGSSPETFALLVTTVPVAVGVAKMVILTPAPDPIVFRLQVIVPADWLQLPCVGGDTETPLKVKLAGSVSVRIMLEAAEGPELDTLIKYCRLWPTRTGSGE
jgi:hypothetical protein